MIYRLRHVTRSAHSLHWQVTTVSTTPLTTALYPPWYQKKIEKWRRGEIDWDGNPTEGISSSQEAPLEKLHAGQDVRRLMVYLRLDSLPSIFSLIGLLGNQTHVEAAKTDRADNTAVMKKPPMEVHGLRVVELTERTSSVMQVTEGEEAFSLRDPVVGAFRTFAQLNDLAVSGRVAVVPEDSYAETLVSQASDLAADFALVPWSENGNVVEDQLLPFSVDTSDRFKSPVHLEFMHAMLQKAARVCDTGIFIDNGFGGITKPVDRPGLRHTLSALSLRSHVQQVEATAFPVPDKSHHIFFPFLGGPDDRAALRFVLQLAQNRLITATIKVYTPGHRGDGSSGHEEAGDVVPSAAGTASATAFGAKTIPTTTMSDFTASDQSLLATLQSSLPSELVGRVSFKEVSLAESIPSSVLRDVLAASQEAVGQAPRNAGDVVVVGRQHAHLGDAVGFETPAGYDLKTTVGAVAEQMVAKGVKASLLVIQAGIKGTREPSTSSG